jgi:protein-disulfide isomerase
VALLRQQGLVVRRDADGGTGPAEEGGEPDEAAADDDADGRDDGDAPGAAGAAADDDDAARARVRAQAMARQAQAGAAGAGEGRRVGRARPAMPASTVARAVGAGAGDARRVWVPLTDAPALGPADALVTVVAFVDPQCPFSARLFPTLLAVREAHPADVRLVVRLRPLSHHRDAWGASVLLGLAKAQRGDAGFFAALSYLYADDRQRDLGRAALDRYAAALGLDVLRLADALDAPAVTDLDRAVADDDAVGESVPVNGTPSMLVNGALVSGAVPRERVEALVAGETRRARAALAAGARRATLYDTLARTPAPAAANPAARNRPSP